MGNKTIYVQDETLWKNAKRMAGKAGLSGVIAQALREYVDRAESGFAEFRFELIDKDAPDDAASDFIGFEGKRVASDECESAERGFAYGMEVFRTKGGSLLLTARILDAEPDDTLVHHWGKHPTLSSLGNDRFFQHVTPDARASFMGTVARALGKDFVTWID